MNPTAKPEGTVTFKHNGDSHTASWTVEKGVLTVWNDKTRKSTLLGEFAPKILARLVLRQMVKNKEV